MNTKPFNSVVTRVAEADESSKAAVALLECIGGQRTSSNPEMAR